MSATTTAARASTGLITFSLTLAFGLIGLVAIFWPESSAAFQVWITSTAYGHCFLVAPMSAYLLWDRREELRGLVPRPTPALALLILPLPLAWFAAERMGLMEGRQLVALTALQVFVLSMLGWRLFYAVLGPMLYLYFLVPFGAFTTPALQSFTAWFINAGLTLLGIPHFSNEMVIEIAAGTFFVAEACAGLRFLIASVAFGVFYALLNYRSPGRRIIFIAASIIVPIIANGIRALAIVLLGHVLGSAEAAAADHVIYGWVFFSIVMLLLVIAGLPLREMPAAKRDFRPRQAGSLRFASGIPALVTVLGVAATGPGAALVLDRNMTVPVLAGPIQLITPDGCVDTGSKPSNSAGLERTLRCGAREWTIAVQAASPRGTGNTLTNARHTLVGPIDTDEATTGPLRNVPEEAGNWQVIASRDPAQVTAVSVWIHGVPARGGLMQRITQARDSVFGNTIPPILIAVSTTSNLSGREAEFTEATAELRQIVRAQTTLAAEVARLSGATSR